MNADIENLRTIFDTDRRFLIPIFQRRYVWEEEKQWKPLWEDVCSTAEHYLEEKGSIAVEHMHGHFIGAAVFQLQPGVTRECEKKLVIDGQQRLTTLQLLLGATQKVFEEFDSQAADHLQNYVRNNESRIHDDRDHIFKVWPTLMDQDAFRHVMSNEPPNIEYKASQIFKAYKFFEQQVHKWIKDDPGERVDALETTITRLLKIAVIDIDINDDPNIIFEALNDRGTPLIQAELVKNFILYTAGDDGDHLYHNHLKKLESNWWKKEIRQGRLPRPRVDIFLNYWITMQGKTEVQAGKVFSAVRKYASEGSVTAVASEISSMADVYHRLQDTKDDGTALRRFLYRWRAMDLGVLTPVLMRILSFELENEKLERCLRIIESYLVRRMVCDMDTRGYNNLFLSLLQELEKENADETIRLFLQKQDAAARIWPNNGHLQNAFLHDSLYQIRSRGRLQFVLEAIENWLRDAKTEEPVKRKGLTVEHVMPQGWREADWPLPETMADPAEAKEQRNRLIHTIGNLTLVTREMNGTLSNAPWDEKRETLKTYSVLRLKESIVSEDAWNEETIRERSRYLAKVAAEVWPYADRI